MKKAPSRYKIRTIKNNITQTSNRKKAVITKVLKKKQKTPLTSHYCSHNCFFSKKIVYPACERNKCHILEVLKTHFDAQQAGNVLEIASGTGQHISYFASHFPNLIFQPSEWDASLFGSLMEYARETPTKNVKYPVKIDVTTDSSEWNLNLLYDYIINVNMIHISPFKCAEGLFRNGCNILKVGGLLITYGPYAQNGVITPESNVNFDKSLRRQNPEWGLKDIEDLKKIAESCGVTLLKIYDLPANNKCLVWKKES